MESPAGVFQKCRAGCIVSGYQQGLREARHQEVMWKQRKRKESSRWKDEVGEGYFDNSCRRAGVDVRDI